MAPRWLRPAAPPWQEVRAALLEAASGFPQTAFHVAGLDATPAVGWTDGPGGETFADAVGEIPGWTWMAGDPGGDVGVSGPVLFVRRELSELATAIAVVRFYGAHGRHWSSKEGATGRAAWRALTDVDDPSHSGYPIPDTMADLLLAEPDPPGHDRHPTRADALSAKLAAVGYEKLWAVAFAAVG